MDERTRTIEAAVAAAAAIARDNTHGYDQQNRWGPDYDCSSLIIHCWQTAGVALKCSYTGDMRADMLRCGFADVTAATKLETGGGLCRGDVLLNDRYHTALYIGQGRIVHASANERSAATGGISGDQTGREICERSYYNYPWLCVLRYIHTENESPAADESPAEVKLPPLKWGDKGAAVAAMQGALKYAGYDPVWVDGELGAKSHAALAAFQAGRELRQSGVCTGDTWRALLNEGAQA